MKRFIVVVLVFVVVVGGAYWWFMKSGTNQPSVGVSSSPSPAGVTPTPAISGNPQITPKEVAVNFFQACANGDWSQASTYCPWVNEVKDGLEGIQVVNIGEPIKIAPNYPGVGIPYEIKLRTGDIRKFRLAIRNDNPKRIWQIDGGL